MDTATNCRINALTFNLYTPDEIRTISVKEITSDALFDRFSARTVDGGLHDQHLGPATLADICEHCGLLFTECNGHFGHIEFAKPVYNPLYFDVILKILKSFCFNCFKLMDAEFGQTALHFLGVLSVTPREHELGQLSCKSREELRKLAIRGFACRPRHACNKCHVNAWIIKHIARQQIAIRPSTKHSESKRRQKNADESSGFDSFALVDSNQAVERLEPDGGSRLTKDSAMYGDIEKRVRAALKSIQLSEARLKEHPIVPELVKDLFRLVWVHERDSLLALFPMLINISRKLAFATDVFFMDNMLVTPVLCRWPRMMAGMAFEHRETTTIARVVKASTALRNVVRVERDGEKSAELTGKRLNEAIRVANAILQAAVNGVFCSDMGVLHESLVNRMSTGNRNLDPGLKERLERKEGLFRMHMMGKRVNFAARSVISPDPNLNVDEVGVPIYFALRLSFPEPVNAVNLEFMRQLVLNGPKKHPGAVSLRMPNGMLISIHSEDADKRSTLAAKLHPPQSGSTCFIVNRHLMDGDMLVMNRQPTLHRPSMQAHRVRIIRAPNAKTLRMHYSNCKAYNADFDGDEMNGHFVQSYCAKAELENIAAVPFNYVVPKDGSPLAGLIQDHVIAAVKVTMKNRFFMRDDYFSLVYHALNNLNLPWLKERGNRYAMQLPCMLKPYRMWSGKQVISTLLQNLVPPKMPLLSVMVKGKQTKAELWAGVKAGTPTPMSDMDLVICGGYMCSGILEKAHIGGASGGLVHHVYEAYGAQTAANLLTAISRMSNQFLKMASFTLGLKDIMLSEEADQKRSKAFSKMQDLGLLAFADAFELSPDDLDNGTVQKLYRRAQFATPNDEKFYGKVMALDGAVKNRLKRAQDSVCDTVVPHGLYVPFPENNLQLMVNVGAKGGLVNAQQMSVALGQIELEGRRVPLMLSGRSLPSFPPYDVRARAGGMCTHRFLSSMPPQELFFHSMAGRDGLIDTAVKTSRSGYLQRSVIKHLEDMMIQYDGTVRDAGQNVLQFRYGDDGADVTQTAFFNPAGVQFYMDNVKLFHDRWRSAFTQQGEPLISAIRCSNKLLQMIDKVAVANELVINKVCSSRKLLRLAEKAKEAQRRLEENEYTKPGAQAEPPCEAADGLRFLIKSKTLLSAAPAGDPVGLIAAQSIGEPSTQMTLNTFHFAGRGEMNVTLGIPRLREILMTNTREIKTPFMEVPVHNTSHAKSRVVDIAKQMYRLRLMEVLQMPLSMGVDYATDCCTFTFNIKSPKSWSDRSDFKAANIVKFFERVVFTTLAKQMEHDLKDRGKSTEIRSFALNTAASVAARNFDPDAGDEEAGELRQKMRADGRLRQDADEWNEEDGAEAGRRRRMEVELADDDVEDASAKNKENAETVDDGEAEELQELRRGHSDKYRVGEEAASEEEEEEDNASVMAQEPSTTKRSAQRPTETVVVSDYDANDEEDEADSEDLLRPGPADEDTQDSTGSMDWNRVSFIKSLHLRFSDYSYDPSPRPKWIKLSILMYDPKEGRIGVDLKTMIQKILDASVLSSIPGIKKTILDKSKSDAWVFKVEGCNFRELVKYADVFELDKLYMNNVNEVYKYYGIEAAREAIIKEVSSVFGHYGIHVNSRHLGLVSDYMTRTGQVRAFNRMSMEYHPSPIQRATFETSVHFIKGMIQDQLVESTMSPSGSILTSRLVRNCGTNCFSLIQKLPQVSYEPTESKEDEMSDEDVFNI